MPYRIFLFAFLFFSSLGGEIRGNFNSQLRMEIDSTRGFSFFRNNLTLQYAFKEGKNTDFFGEIHIKNKGFPFANDIFDMQNSAACDRTMVEAGEVYFDVMGLFKNSMDMRIGRQRISWGTADGVNPTDNLNPFDLEDIWDFNSKKPSFAVNAKWYYDNWTLQGVYEPFFNLPVLPDSAYFSLFFNANTDYFGLVPQKFSYTVENPSPSLGNPGLIAAKISGNIKGFDLSASYLYGRNYVPYPDSVAITPILDSLRPIPVNIEAYLAFPRMHVAGFDFAGSIKDIGIWGEAGLFIPDRDYFCRINDFRSPVLVKELMISKSPYLKFTVGGDYIFANNYYVNLQFVRGLFFEQGDSLNSYLILRTQKTLFDETLEISPVSGILEIDSLSSIKSSFAYVFNPYIKLNLYDNAHITAGIRIIGGKHTATMDKLKDNVYVQFNYKF